MKNCPYCAEPIAQDAILCKHCGQSQLPGNRLNLVVSLSLVSVAALVAVAYWLLSDVIWLPLAQSGFYFVIDRTTLQGYVPYWTGEIQRQSFFNAGWLIFGALIYIPLVSIALMRFGARRTTVVALLTPMPFAVMDIWTWWVRSVRLPAGVDPSALRPRPGILQFLAVLFLSGILIALLHLLAAGVDSMLSRRKMRFSLAVAHPIQSVAPVTTTPPAPAAHPVPIPPPAAASGPDLGPDSETTPMESGARPAPGLPPGADFSADEARIAGPAESGLSSAHVNSAVISAQLGPMIAEPSPASEVEPDADTQISASTFERLVQTPISGEPSDAVHAVQSTASGTLESEPRQRTAARPPPAAESGVPAWMIVTGMAVLIVVGFILIILAFRL